MHPELYTFDNVQRLAVVLIKRWGRDEAAKRVRDIVGLNRTAVRVYKFQHVGQLLFNLMNALYFFEKVW